MAAGAGVFTTRLGALPETTGGHAAMVDWQHDKAKLSESFAAMVIQTLRDMRKNPEAATSRREQRLLSGKTICGQTGPNNGRNG
jgi:hypothetical protein